MKTISADELKERIIAGRELALIDVRTTGEFAKAHLLFAVSVPLDKLELVFDQLVPRLGTPIVFCDEGSGLADQAAERLLPFGYNNLEILQGGIQAWREAGYEIFSGINVPSKAFGEFVEHEYSTPHVSANELKAKIDAGEKLVILDSRPMSEFNKMNIPGASCCPGAELVYRVTDASIDTKTLVVVNCAGRTRSIIGCQSLINAGIPNPVVALKDGTMGWHLAGFELEKGQVRSAPNVSKTGLQRSKEMADAVRTKYGVRRIGLSKLQLFQDQSQERSLFLLDVRSPEEFESGHLPGSQSAPGGQLVQATDEFVGVRNARLVLIDDTGVRAAMTASWLIQMGWDEVYVLEGGLENDDLEIGKPPRKVLGLEETRSPKLSAEQANQMITGGSVSIFDLADSLEFREGHLPGAKRTSRSILAKQLENQTEESQVLLTSPDGAFASLTAEDVGHKAGKTISFLDGGVEAWRLAGYTLEQGDDLDAGELSEDVWYKPYQRTDAIDEAMKAYLTWEVALVEQIERDGTTNFKRLDSSNEKVREESNTK